MKKVSLFALLLISIIILSFVCSSTAFAVEGNYNYALNDDTTYHTLTTVDIMRNVLGVDLTDLEKDYLSTAELTLSYSSRISSSSVTASLEGNMLTVRTLPYRYTARNGSLVCWYPYSVGDIELSENDYDVNIDVTDYSTDFVDVTFVSDFAISYSDFNKYLNATYDYSKSASDKIDSENERYSKELDDYRTLLNAYDDYLTELAKYEDEKKAYDDYLEAYDLWKTADEKYQAYLTALQSYNEARKKYDDYLTELDKYNENVDLYMKYLDALKTYQEELDEYNKVELTPEQQSAKYHLGILKYIVTPVTSLRRTLSGAITGDAVTQVLAEKKSLVTLGGVEARAVDLAATATENLRPLITQYKACKTDAERYAYYILSKDELSKNFNDLLCALDFLYQNPDYNLVRMGIADRDRTEQFEILLAQLYYVCNALTEDAIPNYVMRFKGANKDGAGYFDQNYQIGYPSKRTPSQIVGKDGVLEDLSDSAPLQSGYPGLPTRPTAPKKVSEPIKPKEVFPPSSEPEKVDEPSQAPAEVLEPQAPAEVSEPEEPQPYTPTKEERTYADAYRRGVLTYREPYAENVVVRVTSVLTKYFRNIKTVNVRFFNGMDPEPVYVCEQAEIGMPVEYVGELPKKEKTGYECVFAGWVDENGVLVDCNRLNTDKTDLNLYPSFKEIPKKYAISWNVDGSIRTAEYSFDTVPVYDRDLLGEIEKIRTGVREYRFIGWQSDDNFYGADDDLPVVSDKPTTYTAVFESSYVVTWIVDGIGSSYPIWQGEIPFCPIIPAKQGDAYRSYSFVGWDVPVVRAESDVTYTAVFDKKAYVSSNLGALKVEDKTTELYVDASYANGDLYLSPLLERAYSENKKIHIDLYYGKLYFSENVIKELRDEFVDAISLNVSASENAKYVVNFVTRDGGGNVVCSENGITLVLEDITVYENSYLKYADPTGTEDEMTYVSTDNNSIKFTVNSGYSYTLRPKYHVNAVSIDGVTYRVSVDWQEAGENVYVETDALPEGYYLKSIYVVSASGTDIAVQNNAFVMPTESVTVGLILDRLSYKISFVASGKVLFTQVYKHGDEVTAPKVPDHVGENGYLYKFTGWDKEITSAYCDVEYVALFEKQAIVDNSKKPVAKFTNMIIALISVGAGVVVALAVIIPVVVVKKKKRKNRDGHESKK